MGNSQDVRVITIAKTGTVEMKDSKKVGKDV